VRGRGQDCSFADEPDGADWAHLARSGKDDSSTVPDLMSQPDIDHCSGKEPDESADEDEGYDWVRNGVIILNTKEERTGRCVAPACDRE
jgi:hypothetical protein